MEEERLQPYWRVLLVSNRNIQVSNLETKDYKGLKVRTQPCVYSNKR